MKTGTPKPVRCAIYTRVSTDQGLEQDFNSIDAQYEASQAYIRSQVHAGWTLVRFKYDDGGFSGGNTARPALQRLLKKGWIRSQWKATESGRRARYYSITHSGGRQLEREREGWARASGAVDRVLGWAGTGGLA